MTLTTDVTFGSCYVTFQMPVRSMTLTTTAAEKEEHVCVSDACQINDFDHKLTPLNLACWVSDACQINDFDHSCLTIFVVRYVSDACQINDFDQVMRNSVRGTSVAVFWIASGVCF